MNFKTMLQQNMQLLIEYDQGKTLANWGQKLSDRAKKDPTARKIAEQPDQILAQVELGDPTPHKEYTQWLVRAYINGTEHLEDIKSTIGEALLKYNTLKKKKALIPEHRDINTIKTTQDLEHIVRSPEYASKLEDKEEKDKGQSELIYNGPRVQVRKLGDKASAIYYGQGTRWCTAASTGNNMYDYYAKDGPIYVVLPKKPEVIKDHGGSIWYEKYQLHTSSRQCKDVFDHTFKFGKLLEKFPELKEVFKALDDFADIEILHRGDDWQAQKEAQRKKREDELAALIASFQTGG